MVTVTKTSDTACSFGSVFLGILLLALSVALLVAGAIVYRKSNSTVGRVFTTIGVEGGAAEQVCWHLPNIRAALRCMGIGGDPAPRTQRCPAAPSRSQLNEHRYTLNTYHNLRVRKIQFRLTRFCRNLVFCCSRLSKTQLEQ